MLETRELFGIAKIDNSDFEEIRNNMEIYLKYYKTKLLQKSYDKKFGIEIIKEEKNGKNVRKEKVAVNRLSDNEETINKILTIFINNKVTPITSNEIISDLKKNYYENKRLI